MTRASARLFSAGRVKIGRGRAEQRRRRVAVAVLRRPTCCEQAGGGGVRCLFPCKPSLLSRQTTVASARARGSHRQMDTLPPPTTPARVLVTRGRRRSTGFLVVKGRLATACLCTQPTSSPKSARYRIRPRSRGSLKPTNARHKNQICRIALEASHREISARACETGNCSGAICDLFDLKNGLPQYLPGTAGSPRAAVDCTGPRRRARSQPTCRVAQRPAYRHSHWGAQYVTCARWMATVT